MFPRRIKSYENPLEVEVLMKMTFNKKEKNRKGKRREEKKKEPAEELNIFE